MTRWGGTPSSCPVCVTEYVDNGKTRSTTTWGYDSNRSQHLVPKLGRRAGKHSVQRKAHLTEREVISNQYYQEELASGFQNHRNRLKHARKLAQRESPTLARAQRETLILARASMEAVLC